MRSVRCTHITYMRTWYICILNHVNQILDVYMRYEQRSKLCTHGLVKKKKKSKCNGMCASAYASYYISRRNVRKKKTVHKLSTTTVIRVYIYTTTHGEKYVDLQANMTRDFSRDEYVSRSLTFVELKSRNYTTEGSVACKTNYVKNGTTQWIENYRVYAYTDG